MMRRDEASLDCSLHSFSLSQTPTGPVAYSASVSGLIEIVALAKASGRSQKG